MRVADSWCVRLVGFGLLAGCGSGGNAGGAAPHEHAAPTTGATAFGEAHTGQYHLGPVDFAETEWHNACAPGGGYRTELRDATGLGGEYLAGVANQYAEGGAVCDACILIETATDKSIVARVVTYGVEQAAGDIDVSPSVYSALNEGEYPRTMTWRFAACPAEGPLRYEFQTAANAYWSSLWVRTPSEPIAKVEVKSTTHADFFELRRETDGTVNDDGGFGEGAFTLRVTATTGAVVTESFPSLTPGALLAGRANFE